MTDHSLSPVADLEPLGDGSEFTFEAADRLCVGVPARRYLHGGVAYAACIEAMERVTGLPAIQVSAQFLSVGQPGERIALRPRVTAHGKTIRQATLTAAIGEQPFITAQGSFGRRDSPLTYAVPMPPVPSWAESELRSVVHILSTRIEKMYEFRLAAGELPDRSDWASAGGREIAFWTRPRGGQPISRAILAIVADFAPIALHGALGRLASGSSLDNTIRYVTAVEADWVLCRVAVDSVHDGLVHVTTQQFAPCGQLMAIATQSLILRLWDRL